MVKRSEYSLDSADIRAYCTPAYPAKIKKYELIAKYKK